MDSPANIRRRLAVWEHRLKWQQGEHAKLLARLAIQQDDIKRAKNERRLTELDIGLRQSLAAIAKWRTRLAEATRPANPTPSTPAPHHEPSGPRIERNFVSTNVTKRSVK